jgi:hypothetical protein
MKVQRITSETDCTTTICEALNELDRIAPTAPLLALGQTIFWDEPMKAGVLLAAQRNGKKRKLVAGVHDTDYFAKLPTGERRPGQFKAVPHNDTKTRGLWSAAAEFSALFGSETVVTKESLLNAGLRLEKVSKGRPNLLDEATEAWGWRGIVSLDEDPPIAADVPLEALYPELRATLDWAIDISLQSVGEPERALAQERASRLREIVENAYLAEPGIHLADFYRKLLPDIYNFCAGEHVELETAKSTELLQFNRKTCAKPRFDLVNLFVSPESSDAARDAYNQALKGSEIYGLDRFGSGAIPFDLVIPGRGRGTIRVAPRAIVIMTHEPLFISIKQPIRHVQDLAEAITSKLGDNCVLIGKAVTLIGMLAREFVFIFHEGASGYVKHTRKLHTLLHDAGFGLKMNPILRVRLAAWDSLQECASWVRLPEPFQRPFGTEELTAPSFAARWKDVVQEQDHLLDELSRQRRPLDFIQFLEHRAGGSWHCLAQEYGELHKSLEQLESRIKELKEERRSCYGELRELKQARVQAERDMGEHFRAHIFERKPNTDDLEERARLHQKVEEKIHAVLAKKKQIKELLARQSGHVSAPEIRAIHERRRTIELESELKRLRLIRQAVITAKGLTKANNRPSAWWFPLLCPDGGWFRATMDRAECYLEPLAP